MKIDTRKMHIAMANAGIDSRELQERSGVPKGTMSNAFNRKSLRPSTVGKIARALGVPVTDIMADERDQRQEKLHMLSEEQLNQKVELLLQYTDLGVRLSGFHSLNPEWKPEYDIEIQNIREEMLAIRQQLGMEDRG